MDFDLYDEPIPVPRGGVQFPLELRPPPGFLADDLATWPKVTGRLEFVGGRLLFMPPCGDDQLLTAASLIGVLESWAAEHPEFRAGGNEAGMRLGREIRGADGAVWKKSDLLPRTGGFVRAAPVLAVEIAGKDEGEPELRDKARWYFEHGVSLVWILLPKAREVVVLRADGSEARCVSGQRLPAAAELPGLEPDVDRFFRQLD